MERKKRSKGRGWESCYVKKIYGTFGVEMRAYGQKLVKFCTHTHAAKLVVEIPQLLYDALILRSITIEYIIMIMHDIVFSVNIVGGNAYLI